MIGSIFQAFDARCFDRLVAIRQFFYTFVGCFLNRREALWVARLSCAVWSDLAGIITEFIRCSFVSGDMAFVFAVSTHCSSSQKCLDAKAG
jgi:hypothetical protein